MDSAVLAILRVPLCNECKIVFKSVDHDHKSQIALLELLISLASLNGWDSQKGSIHQFSCEFTHSIKDERCATVEELPDIIDRRGR